MQNRRIGAGGHDWIDHRRKRPVLNPDMVERVFGKVAGCRTYDSNRLADIARAVHRDAVIAHRRGKTDDQRISQ